jgi:hypothetical protein
MNYQCLEVSNGWHKTMAKGIDMMKHLKQLEHDLDELIV